MWTPKEQVMPGTATDLDRHPLPAAAPHSTARGLIPLPAQRPSMEESTVTPSPASSTEEDDPCEIDVTSMAIHSVTLLICLCGLAGNGAVLCLLSLKDPNIKIFNLAVVDFFFLLFTVPSALLFLVEEVSCSTIMSQVYLSFLYQMSVVSYYWGLWRLTDTSIGMGMYKLYQGFCHCRLPERLLWVVHSVEFWAFFTLITVIPTVTSLCPSHKREQCRVALISTFAFILLLFAAPDVITRSLNFIKAKCGSQQQQLNKRDIVIFLILLFTLLLTIWNFLHQLGYIVVSFQVFFLLTCINSTYKPFIYFLVGRCLRTCPVGSLRESLQRVFEEQEDNSASKKDTTTDTVVLAC